MIQIFSLRVRLFIASQSLRSQHKLAMLVFTKLKRIVVLLS